VLDLLPVQRDPQAFLQCGHCSGTVRTVEGDAKVVQRVRAHRGGVVPEGDGPLDHRDALRVATGERVQLGLIAQRHGQQLTVPGAARARLAGGPDQLRGDRDRLRGRRLGPGRIAGPPTDPGQPAQRHRVVPAIAIAAQLGRPALGGQGLGRRQVDRVALDREALPQRGLRRRFEDGVLVEHQP
jgi:hypothetical protein